MAAKSTKRLWDAVSVRRAGDGFGVYLDDKPLRTPAKEALEIPTRALAEKIAGEWDAQQDRIDPDKMPFTRIANSATDKVSPQMAEVVDMLAAYGDADLLCYRAETPIELVQRQNAAWDPVLDWAAQTLGARLTQRIGIVHVPQSTAELAQLKSLVHEFSSFELAAFHDLVALTGSLILGFAAIKRVFPVRDIWALSRIDEDWQIEQWGNDAEANALATTKQKSFFDAETFFHSCTKKT